MPSEIYINIKNILSLLHVRQNSVFPRELYYKLAILWNKE